MENLTDRSRGLDDLVAERGILETKYRYLAAVDYHRVEDYVDAFTEDGVFEVVDSGFGVTARRIQGHKALREYISAKPVPRPGTMGMHLNVNPRIQVKGDTATAVSYLLSLKSSEGAGPSVNTFGMYEDVFVKGADGVWRMKHSIFHAEATLPTFRALPAAT